MNVSKAIQALRKHAKLSQQIFATSTGVSIAALQLYEAGRTPQPKQLEAFRSCAERLGRIDLVVVFEKAIEKSLGLPVPYSEYLYGPRVLSPTLTEYLFEPQAIEGLQRCLSGSPDFADVGPLVTRALAEAIERLAEREHDPVRVKQLRMIRPLKRRKEKK